MPARSVSIAAFSPKPLIITLAPCLASARAMASPIPEVEPVTTADFPFSMMSPWRSAGAAVRSGCRHMNEASGILVARLLQRNKPCHAGHHNFATALAGASGHLGRMLGGETDRAALPDIVEMRIQKAAGCAAAELMQPLEEIVIVVEPAVGAESLAGGAHRDAMQPDPPAIAAPNAPPQPSLIDQLVDELDRPQLCRQRGVEGNLAGTVHDLARARRHFAALARVDLHDQQILGARRPNERQQRRIVAVAAVPIGLSLDLHRTKQERQAGRCHHHLGGDLGTIEYAGFAGADIGRRDEELAAEVGADQLEIDEAFDQLLQRIDVERIEIIGRPELGQRAEPGSWRARAR